VPKIWERTVDEHRDAVREAIAHATASVLHERGLAGFTMSAIAEAAGIGRATLYRYAKDTDAALALWQAYGIEHHLEQLRKIAVEAAPDARLPLVLEQYALNRQRRHGPAGLDLVHPRAVIDPARSQVTVLLTQLIDEERSAGRLPDGTPADELAAFAIAALEAAADAASPAAAKRVAHLVLVARRAESSPAPA
jgi:AcrR family transcriptional regulator